MKRIVSVMLLVIMICTFVFPLNIGFAADDSYTMKPAIGETYKADTEAGFVLNAPKDFTLEQAMDIECDDPSVILDVTQSGEGVFNIKPEFPLAYNKVYKFSLDTPEGTKNWAFQTKQAFQIVSTYPSDDKTGVPINAGIEINFSLPPSKGIEENISITPAVNGNFQYNGSTVIFVPSEPLSYDTYYTVKVGNEIEDSEGRKLPSDYEFRFLVISKETETSNIRRFIAFFSPQTCFTTDDELKFRGDIYNPDEKSEINLYYELYRISDMNTAIETFLYPPEPLHYNEKFDVDALVAQSKITKVSSYSQKISGEQNRMYYNFEITLEDELSEGYYFIYTYTDDSEPSRCYFQVGNIGVDIFEASNQKIAWVNDIKTNKPIKNAVISDDTASFTAVTDAEGIAQISADTTSKYYTVKLANGKETFVTPSWGGYPYDYYYRSNVNNDYWTFLQLDRALFKKNDTLNYWGFIKSRGEADEKDSLILNIHESYMSSAPVYREKIIVDNGYVCGEITLPDFDEGTYYLSISDGDKTLVYEYFTVKSYTKPDYKMTITPSEKVVNAGDIIDFDINCTFFDGTPVSNLDVAYSVQFDSERITATASTDINGNVTVSYVPAYKSGMQGFVRCYVNAEALLPEKAYISADSSVSVLVTDAAADITVSRNGKNAELELEAYAVDISDAKITGKIYSDQCKGEILSGKNVDVKIYRQYSQKVEEGTYYDVIEKQTRKRYYYTRHEEEISSFSVKTDKNGKAHCKFTVPDRKKESYYAVISFVDSAKHTVSYKRYIGKQYSYSDYDYKRLRLEKDKDVYLDGDCVNVKVMYGEDKPENVKTLFMVMKNGIISYSIKQDQELSFVFDDSLFPGCYVFAIALAKSGYSDILSCAVNADKEQRKINLNIESDKIKYRPGDECTVKITATNPDGKPIETNLNLAIVDEALLALENYEPDALTELYVAVASGYISNSRTHKFAFPEEFGYGASGGGAASNKAFDSVASAPVPNESENLLREDFKDTALFANLSTNKNGEATHTFTLPHNTSSWRICASAVSSDLYAATSYSTMVSTLPMFINYTLANSFLTGDIPTLGVNVYGDELLQGETVHFEVYDSDEPSKKVSANGKVFDRINIPLWEMDSPGEHELIIKAITSGGKSDALSHKYSVTDSYRVYPYTEYINLTSKSTLDVSDAKGTVRVYFTDGKRGKLMSDLVRIAHSSYGNRIEKKVAREIAVPIINEYFGYEMIVEQTNYIEYYNNDGGIGILPASASDLEASVLLLTLMPDSELIKNSKLERYFTNLYNGENAENKITALYGLSLLGEPMMEELQKYLLVENLSAKDMIYLALAFASFEDTETANHLYDKLLSLAVVQENYAYIDSFDKDACISDTSAMLLLATKLNTPEKDAFYNYCASNQTNEFLKTIQQLMYITSALEDIPADLPSLTYELWGEERTVDFNNGVNSYVSLPANMLQSLALTNVQGDASAVVCYDKTSLDNLEHDDKITVKRRYYRVGDNSESTTEFKQGDLIRVNLWIDYSDKAIDGLYTVNEYIPSGMEYVKNSARLPTSEYYSLNSHQVYAQIDGNRITFNDYNGCYNNGRLYYYDLRVVSPGIYRAEGTTVQRIDSNYTITTGSDDMLIVK